MFVSATVDNALASVKAALAAVGKLEGASQVALAPVIAAANSAKVVFDTEQARIEGLVDETSLGGVTAGVPVPQIIAALNVQANNAQQLAGLVAGKGYLRRLAGNMARAPG